ncbi:unnamed protein product [Lactuca virosa]|uniref:RRM domain-containing protein n=1 Tax=Lactuca virosa TaxID=75947 RepID=A0AAU9NGJ6_9ASTR|nr:unnamed protein product [Lactuca virosa]
MGKLVDVYMPVRRNVKGQEYAFIKYKGVADIEAMENSLNEITVGPKKLMANLSRHPRKPPLDAAAPPTLKEKNMNVQPLRNVYSGLRDGRSFFDVSRGPTVPQPPPTINPSASSVKLISFNKLWLEKSVLIGEVKDFETLENIQSLLGLEGYGNILCTYVGGLQVIIHFNRSDMADKYILNKGLWQKMFNWLVYASKKEPRFERIAWLKIMGVLLLAWGDTSFETIAVNYGRIIEHDNNLETCIDISYGKVRVITSIRKKINEEFSGSINGISYKIGVSEIEEDWYPFKPFTTYHLAESDDDEDRGDEDEEGADDDGNKNRGISETMGIDDLEDGKIDQNVKSGEIPRMREPDDTSPVVVAESTSWDGGNASSKKIITEDVESNPHAHIPIVDSSVSRFLGETWVVGPSYDPAAIGPSTPPDVNRNLASNTSPVDENGSRVKRRRINKSNSKSRFQPYLKSNPLSSAQTRNMPPTLSVGNTGNLQVNEPSIDLNKISNLGMDSTSSPFQCSNKL